MQTIAGIFVNWKTTLTSFIVSAFILLDVFGYVHLTDEQLKELVAIAFLVLGALAKDNNQTGKPLD